MNNDRTKAFDVLRSIYVSDTNPVIRREVVNTFAERGNAAGLVELARAEKDPAMKREIVQRLSSMKSKEATDYLLELLK